MLTGDRERALQQSIERHGGNGKVPKLGSASKCAGCKAVLSGHSPIVEFFMQPRLVEPALVIGAKSKLSGGRPIVAQFCRPCGESIMPHLKDALAQLFMGVLAGIAQAEAAREAEDAVGDMDVPDADEPDSGFLEMP